MEKVIVFALALVAGCAEYHPAPGVPETANLPHTCGYGLSPHGTRGMGCGEGYECHRDGCQWVGPGWNGPGSAPWGASQ